MLAPRRSKAPGSRVGGYHGGGLRRRRGAPGSRRGVALREHAGLVAARETLLGETLGRAGAVRERRQPEALEHLIGRDDLVFDVVREHLAGLRLRIRER